MGDLVQSSAILKVAGRFAFGVGGGGTSASLCASNFYSPMACIDHAAWLRPPEGGEVR